jgi:hypothetical protein
MSCRNLFATALALSVLAACASTKMTSMLNPTAGERTLQRVLVYFETDNLSIRQQVEDRFRDRSASFTTEFIPSYTIFFPGRTYTDEEFRASLAEHRIDAALFIQRREAGVTSSVTSRSSTTSCAVWSSSQGCVQTRTTTSGGDRINKPWANFSAQLFETEGGVTIWVATAASGGNAYASNGTLRTSMVNRTVAQLLQDGLISTRDQ